jgi:hypothetical protein
MKKAIVFAASLFVGISAMAQVFERDTIFYSGPSEKHFNLVILSDGYTSTELSKFVTDATSFATAFFEEVPYLNYKEYFNVIIIKVPSNQSGASHPGTATDVTEPAHPVSTVDNYFGSTFDYGKIHRLLVATKTSAISNVLANNFPAYDQALILVNSPYYGGSGGYYSVASTNSSSAQIAIHELGHSFPGLKDEYYPGDIYAAEGINMTKETNPSLVKWRNWIGTNSVGIYQHCCIGNSSEWYKPHQNCKMQTLGPPFCSVCVEGTIEKIHSVIPPVESYIPENSSVNESSYPVRFRLNLINPNPNTLKRTWLLNSSLFGKNIDSVFINAGDLITGTNYLTVSIEDTTQLLRVDNHSAIHVSAVSWTVNKSIVGIKDIKATSSEIEIELYPNPATEFINVRISGEIKGKIKLEIYNLQGRRLKVSTLHNNETDIIDLKGLDRGIYFVKILSDNQMISSQKIIRE